eukprot:90023-Amphidinium_carterae.2
MRWTAPSFQGALDISRASLSATDTKERMARGAGSLRELSNLPTLWSWNASALFATLPSLQRKRVALYKDAAGRYDITVALEAHCTPSLVEGLLMSAHLVLDSVAASNPAATGGIVMAVKTSFLSKFTAAHKIDLVAGRILALELDTCELQRAIVVVAIHLQPTETATWAQVLLVLRDYIHGQRCSTILLLGDFNMDLDVVDRISTATGNMCGKLGNRARLWNLHFPSSEWCCVVPGYSYVHKASACLSCLDRLFVNWSLPVCQAAGLRCELQSSGTPPLQSDHHPIGVRWQVKKVQRDHGIAKWMTAHPKWELLRDSWITLLDNDADSWQKRWQSMLLAFQCAADDVRHLRDEVPPGSPSLDKHLASVALRHLLQGDFAAATAIAHRAPHWHLQACNSYLKLEKGLVNTISKAHTALLDAQAAHAEDLPPAQAHSHRQFLSRLLRMWKTQQLRCASFSIGLDDGPKLSTDEQLQMVLDHWRPVFQKEDSIDENLAAVLLKSVPSFVWPEVDVTVEALQIVLKRAPTTSAGPDGLTYRAMRGSALVAQILVKAAAGIMGGDLIPSCVTESFFAMIPKSSKSLLTPAELRPISLFNCPLKAILKCVGYSLSSALSQWAHLPQWAVIPGKLIHDSQLQLESSCLQLSVTHRQSALCLLDLQMAFPSVSRDWTMRVLHAMDIPTGVARLANVLLLSSASYIQWEGQLRWAFMLTSGLLQGSPLAAFQFIVAIMPWLQHMGLKMDPRGLLAAYMDDIWFATPTCRDFAVLFKGTAMLKSVMGLTVNLAKTFVLLLGDMTDEAWRSELYEAMGKQGRLSQVLTIASSAKHLGHLLGGGDDWDGFAAAKLLDRTFTLKEMRIGLARHLQLIQIVATSVTTHTLGAFVPSATMKGAWSELASQFSAGPKGWARDLLPWGRSLMGLPGDLTTLQEASLMARLGCLQRSRYWLPELEQRVRAAKDEAVGLGSPMMRQWQARGMLVSWRSALNEVTAARIFLLDEECKQIVMQHTATPLRVQIRQHVLPSLALSRGRLCDKIWKWLWTYLGQNYPFKERACEYILTNVKRIGALSSPSVAMATARVALGGVKFQSGSIDGVPLQGCKFCGKVRQCSATESIVTGCYVKGLSQVSRYRWLSAEPPNWLIVCLTLKDPDPKRLVAAGHICGILCDCAAQVNETSDALMLLKAASKRWHLRH